MPWCVWTWRRAWLERQAELAEQKARLEALDASLREQLRTLSVEDVRALLRQEPSEHVVFVEDVETRYEFVRELGQGGFGVVHLAARRGSSSPRFAVKTYPPVPAAIRRRGEPLLKAFIISGVACSLTHDNIVRYIEFLVDERRSVDGLRIATVMENLAGPDLFDWLEDQESHWFGRREAWRVFRQVLGGLGYLHTMRPLLVHRDVKPENMRWSSPGCELLKLVDFGFVFVEGYEDAFSGIMIGTRLFSAPEMLRSLVPHPPPTALDLFSAGVILHLLLTGSVPRRREDGSAILSDSWSSRSATGLEGAMLRLLSTAPADRPSAQELLCSLSGTEFPDTVCQPEASDRLSMRTVRIASSKSRFGLQSSQKQHSPVV